MSPRDPRVDESGIPMPGTNGAIKIKAPPAPALPRFDKEPVSPPPPPKLPLPTHGTAGTVAAIASLVLAMGGGATIRELFGPSVTKDDVAALAKKLDAVEAKLDVVQEQFKASEEARVIQREQIEYLASWVCAENDGKLGPDFDACDAHTWEPPPAGHSSPVRRTFGRYPR